MRIRVVTLALSVTFLLTACGHDASPGADDVDVDHQSAAAGTENDQQACRDARKLQRTMANAKRELDADPKNGEAKQAHRDAVAAMPEGFKKASDTADDADLTKALSSASQGAESIGKANDYYDSIRTVYARCEALGFKG